MKSLLRVLFLLLFCSTVVQAQNFTVKGTVTSADDGLTVIGAAVTVKGNTSIGTVTDFDGNFSLSVPSGTKKIQVSYVGYKTQEASVKPGAVLKIVLETDAEVLDEVVVTGIQKMDKRLFTGATTKLDADKTKLDGIADVSRALEGRAAGVSVQNVSGTFGTAPKIRVRGATSIYGNSTPLWVVDGVVIEDAVDVSADDLSSGDATTLISSAIAGLNADDIESFQVLKDGSATSIYGARAMAGVVVITTKRGKTGVSSINYTGEFTTRMKPNYRNYNISNSQEQMGIYKEMQAKGWLNFSSLINASSSGVYGRMYSSMTDFDENGNYYLKNTEAAMNDYLRQAEMRNTDWFDLLFKNTVMQNHAVSISGGTDKAKMYASLSALYDPGWTAASSVQRYTANMNASFNISKWVTLSMLTNGSYRKQEAPGTLSQDVDPVSGQVKRSFDINPYSYCLNTSRTLDPSMVFQRNYAPFNIFDELENNYINLDIKDLRFQTELNWKPILGLEMNALVAYRVQSTANEHFVKDDSNMAEAYRAGVDNPNVMYSNPYLYQDPDKPGERPVSVMKEGGIYYRNDYSVSQLDFRGTIQYNKVTADEKHIFNIFAGMEVNSTDRNQVFFEGYGFLYNSGNIPSMDPNLFLQMKDEGRDYYGNTWSYSRSLAYFASGTYSYKGKYTMNLTGRYEGTNQLGKSRSARWLPTYNIAFAWNAHEEDFFQRINNWMSHLTLKTSYSLTADRGPSNISNALPIYYSSQVWRPDRDLFESAIVLSDIANSGLTYEKKKEFNLGADLGFFNNRVNLALDVYWRDNYDLIGPIATQGVGGVLNKYGNVASMKSNGAELTLSTTNVKTKDFSWDTDFTFSKTRTEITNLDTRTQVIDLVSGSGYAVEGKPVRALYSFQFQGLNDEGLPTFLNEKGQVTVSDIDFQEYENIGHLKYEGPTDPTITGGFGNIFNYKNFRLNVFITYSFGNKIRLDPVFSSGYSDMTASPKEFKNRWAVPGDEEITTIPTIASTRQVKNDAQLSYAYNAYNYSDERVADGGFIRMKEISLTYMLPGNFVRKIGLSNASLKIQGTNLFLIYADKKLNGQDPEFVNAGGVASPMPKQFTLTLRLGI